MGDLISRKALLDAMDKRYNVKKNIVPNNLAEGFMQMEKLIKEQPTAYDVEKVEREVKDYFIDIIKKMPDDAPEMGWDVVDSNAHICDIVRKGGIENE